MSIPNIADILSKANIPTTTVKLGFDPKKSNNPVIREIFADRVARNIWLGVKSGHLVSEPFDKDCLRISKAVKKWPPKDAKELAVRLRANGNDLVFSNFIADPTNSVNMLAEALFPYLMGDRDFAYEVKRSG